MKHLLSIKAGYLRALGAVWGILGVTLILTSAIVRVWPHAEDAFRIGLSALNWSIFVLWCVFMLYSEGYRGFQKLFAPRVAARAWHLFNQGRPVDLILAPFFVMGYFHTTKKRIINSWSLTIGIALIITAVRFLRQPWRGIIDSGVILGLLYGLVWVYIFAMRTLVRRKYLVNPEIA